MNKDVNVAFFQWYLIETGSNSYLKETAGVIGVFIDDDFKAVN